MNPLDRFVASWGEGPPENDRGVVRITGPGSNGSHRWVRVEREQPSGSWVDRWHTTGSAWPHDPDVKLPDDSIVGLRVIGERLEWFPL